MADIAKMYRQVLLAPEYCDLHRVLWRADPALDISVYHLNTVTYGTASAAFLAIGCLQQLAAEHAEFHPKASSIIKHDFYVDDLLTGTETIEAATEMAAEVCSILNKAGFELRKWSSNNPRILSEIKLSHSTEILSVGGNENTKTLGLLWLPKTDRFSFSIGIGDTTRTISKRIILAEISQIFDPLGLLSPCIIAAKILLQKLWLLKLSWDEAVPLNIHTRWTSCRSKLAFLNQIEIPRHVICVNAAHVELNGFSDSSQEAYGACIYLRSVDKAGAVQSRLLCAKSKVAPLKSISIPRLELCGALVLAKLYEKIKAAMSIRLSSVYFWTDSTIVLGWLNTSPHLLQVFVGNQVTEIQRATEDGTWHHVTSKNNSADILSRGTSPHELINLQQWWCEPTWLAEESDSWKAVQVTAKDLELPEVKKSVIQSCVTINQAEAFPFSRFSSYTRMVNCLAYCFRFINNCKRDKAYYRSGSLTVAELERSFSYLVGLVQQEDFSSELTTLQKGKMIDDKSKISSFSPFLDNSGIIRVGGRLRNSDFSFEKKHPILLRGSHSFTRLIFQHEHIKLLHAGPQLLLATIRERIWLLSGRNLARDVVRKCVICRRFAAKTTNPIMADLPPHRVHAMPPFHVTGVDYAGPFNIKDRQGRGCKVHKAYVCVFVCFATKCLHLELVSSLTTEAFIATFRRFIARRGKPLHVYSDNGTNFIGANSELKGLRVLLAESQTLIGSIFASESINWHFIPAHSPNFGGIWEAGVKSIKFHLKRVLRDSLLTFESFYTVLTQIECILNSRPLVPMSADPNDLEVLTPAHFLIGRPLLAAPDPNVCHIKTSHLSHHQHLQQLNQHFWSRWSKEYISELQQRTKWKKHQSNIAVGSMVLVKEDHLPPARWRFGRVIQVHPGRDSVVRVVSIKTAQGILKRAVSKVCVLPVDNSN